MTTTDHLLDGLNLSQLGAVMDTEGRILVLAGAGAGKTAVLTRRVSYLRAQGVPAWQILCITFTNKAAKEMRERINTMSNGDAKDAWVGTFHSTCLRILTRFGKEIGYDKFTLIDGNDQKQLVKELLKLLGYEQEPMNVLSAISGWKSDMVEPGELTSTLKFKEDLEKAQVYQAYEDKKRELNYMDFDDLLNNVVKLFRARPDIAAIYQNQFRYVMIDEFQDTNKVQFEMIELISAHYGNVFLVGDGDQSIYSFRNAKIENILNYRNVYPETRLHKLVENYRSTKTIVEAANALVENNEMRLDRKAVSMGEQGDPIVMFRGDDDGREADFVANMVNRIKKKENRPFSDFAVLYRTNRQSRAVEMALTQFGIPYKVVSGHAFYARKEIKDLVSYMRAIDNGVDDISFERIINIPKRGIGKTSIERIQSYAAECGIPFAKALEHIDVIPKVTKKAKTAIAEFNVIMTNLREFSLSDEFSVLSMLKMILNATDYYSQFDATKDEDESRIENIQELMNVAGIWDKEEKEVNTLTQFLTETSLASAADVDDDNVVTLTSVHGAKGLEWSQVFVVGVEEGIFPHGRAYQNPMDLEEERRLMYVAMTRAADRLMVSWCRTRYEYGNPRPVPAKPSIFLKEVPQQFVYKIGF